jgi:hypothetical protein
MEVRVIKEPRLCRAVRWDSLCTSTRDQFVDRHRSWTMGISTMGDVLTILMKPSSARNHASLLRTRMLTSIATWFRACLMALSMSSGSALPSTRTSRSLGGGPFVPRNRSAQDPWMKAFSTPGMGLRILLRTRTGPNTLRTKAASSLAADQPGFVVTRRERPIRRVRRIPAASRRLTSRWIVATWASMRSDNSVRVHSRVGASYK